MLVDINSNYYNVNLHTVFFPPFADETPKMIVEIHNRRDDFYFRIVRISSKKVTTIKQSVF